MFFDLRFGSRGPTEIDIAVPRFRESPELVRALLRDRRHASANDFEQLAREAELAGVRICAAVPWWLRPVVRRLIRCTRSFLPIREASKFFFVRVTFHVRQTFLAFSEKALVPQRIVGERDDVFFLQIPELIEIAQALENESSSSSPPLSLSWVRERVDERKKSFERYRDMKPPRVMTSDGEVIEALPSPSPSSSSSSSSSSLVLHGTPASAGVVEGIARVVTDLKKLSSLSLSSSTGGDDISAVLVCRNSDPAWTSVFSFAAGLVLEVGGMHSHGSVVAREMGLPAVAGVDGATHLIRDGQRVRVDGSAGVVEVLNE